MNLTGAFLKHVLPDEGYYIAYFVSGQRKWNEFYDTIDALAEGLLAADARGLTTYHACASFREKRHDAKGVPNGSRQFGRTQRNALAARSLWADIDAGEGKPYADAAVAAQAVARFCHGTGMPRPLFVGSGRGLHLYWPLSQNIDIDTWKQLSTQLKQLCTTHKLHADPVRTSDCASVLRTPGTHWRKGEVREVVCGSLVGPYDIAQIREVLDAHVRTSSPSSLGVTNHNPQWPAHLAIQGRGISAALRSALGEENADADRVAERCGQVRALASSKGNLPEPLWYAALGVVAFCEGGDRVGHEWSSGYPNYAPQETQERLDRARSLSGATTCQKFHGLNPATCEACPFWGKINSPISLGYGYVANPHRTDSTSGTPTDHAATLEKTGETNPFQDLPILPAVEFCWTRTGALVYRTADKNGHATETLISAQPIYLAGMETGESRGEYNYVFRLYNNTKKWFNASVPAEVFNSSQALAKLSALGAVIHDPPLFFKLVRLSLDTINVQGEITRRYDQFGWKDDGFLCGQNLYRFDGTVERVEAVQLGDRGKHLGPIGDLAQWKSLIGHLFTPGCEGQGAAVLASFAAPLMRLQSQTEGGAIISLVTRKSGTGKSTALSGAASVWGAYDGMAITNHDTVTSRFIILGMMGNLPLVYDEVDSVEPAKVRDWVMTFTAGRDKARANRDGSLRAQTATWQTLLITASNGSLVDSLTSTASTEAPAMRILEFPLSVPPEREHWSGDRLQNQLYRHRGVAGDVYLRWLVTPENYKWVQERLPKIADQIWAETKLTPEFRFWVRAVAAMLLAAEIIEKAGILTLDRERMSKWLLARLSRTTDTKSNDDWAVMQLGEFLNNNIGATIVVSRAFVPGKPPMPPIQEPRGRELFVRYEIEPNRYIISSNALKAWLTKKNTGYREFLEVLSEQGVVLDRTTQATLAAGTSIPSTRITCVTIDAGHLLLQGVRPAVIESNVVSLVSATEAHALPVSRRSK